MAQANETRRAWGATGLGKLSFPGGIDNRDINPNPLVAQVHRDHGGGPSTLLAASLDRLAEAA